MLVTLHNISEFQKGEKTFVTIGTFDGVHFGHQRILEKLVSDAKKAGKKSILLTFFPHPRMVLQKDRYLNAYQQNEVKDEIDSLMKDWSTKI